VLTPSCWIFLEFWIPKSPCSLKHLNSQTCSDLPAKHVRHETGMALSSGETTLGCVTQGTRYKGQKLPKFQFFKNQLPRFLSKSVVTGHAVWPQIVYNCVKLASRCVTQGPRCKGQKLPKFQFSKNQLFCFSSKSTVTRHTVWPHVVYNCVKIASGCVSQGPCFTAPRGQIGKRQNRRLSGDDHVSWWELLYQSGHLPCKFSEVCLARVRF
jgi:hypothetical protein